MTFARGAQGIGNRLAIIGRCECPRHWNSSLDRVSMNTARQGSSALRCRLYRRRLLLPINGSFGSSHSGQGHAACRSSPVQTPGYVECKCVVTGNAKIPLQDLKILNDASLPRHQDSSTRAFATGCSGKETSHSAGFSVPGIQVFHPRTPLHPPVLS